MYFPTGFSLPCKSPTMFSIAREPFENIAGHKGPLVQNQITSAGKDVEKEHLDTAYGNINWFSHQGDQCGGVSKPKNRTTI